ncbi:MAG: hypothetical protein IGS03_10695 [Candidatus Sericytochromatia bacterium]|nr:hypothetical protein [Candidatus Sericytochromatia bacterium]
MTAKPTTQPILQNNLVKQDLRSLIQLDRRYSRSVQLERDMDHADAVRGYVITPRAQEALDRFFDALLPGKTRAFTITGVYGTGKSSLAHFITALTSPSSTPSFESSWEILKALSPDALHTKWRQAFEQQVGSKGFVRAVVTARREPIHHTILRALVFGVTKYRAQHKQTALGDELFLTLSAALQDTDQERDFEPTLILEWIQSIQEQFGTGILLIVDELGKAFEYAAQYPRRSDLYLLQQLAEYPSLNARQGLFFFGLLHQAFSEYARSMSGEQFQDWAKVQGRFEDISFTESPEDILRLMGLSLVHDRVLKGPLKSWANTWHGIFKSWSEGNPVISPDVLAQVYPLHPFSALLLPQLCQRYAQNERSLFTFLGSQEPHALPAFLRQANLSLGHLPTIHLDQIYDYFVESANLSISSQGSSQRWLEIQNRLADARQLPLDLQRVLKTIAVFNLVALNSTFRARRAVVVNAMLDLPAESSDADYQYWDQQIDALIAQKFVSWWSSFDELRIWQGSNFDIQSHLNAAVQEQQASLLSVFTQHIPLTPLVAQRHSYITGALRYFERLYYHPDRKESALLQPDSNADGFIYYALTCEIPAGLPSLTADGRPILYLTHPEIDILIQLGKEHAALHQVSLSAPELKTDIVARREIDYRLAQSKRHLIERLERLFHQGDANVRLHTSKSIQHLKSEASLRQLLSKCCDDAYPKRIELWNELINRRELTTQGAKARKVLIQHMLQNNGKPLLDIDGYGPERSIFESLLHHTGLYVQSLDGKLGFTEPHSESSLRHVWQYIDSFCRQAQEASRSIDELFDNLQKPPYGVLAGPLPILLTAYLLCHPDEISLFQDGAFIPVLGLEHFEILFRHPQRFAVKSFAIEGIQSSYFKELETALVSPKAAVLPAKEGVRNQTILSLVSPLMRFVKRLPEYTLKTALLSDAAKHLRQALQQTKDPGQLILIDLPKSLGFSPVLGEQALSEDQIRDIKQALIKSLSELNQAYPKMLDKCLVALNNAFGQPQEAHLKTQLSQRAHFLKEAVSEPLLKRFVLAAADGHKEDIPWLESVVMVVADNPPQYWSDKDFDQFEYQLEVLKQNFLNFEAMQSTLSQSKQNLSDARRIVLTDSGGKERQRIIWADTDHRKQADTIVQDLLLTEKLKDNPRLQEAVLAMLTERILGD